MKKTLLTICLVWMCFSLSAQKIIDLSGKWSFSIDRQDNGEKEKWFSRRPRIAVTYKYRILKLFQNLFQLAYCSGLDDNLLHIDVMFHSAGARLS